MPEKITLSDGSEREVPTAEELKGLQDKAASADTISAQLAEAQKAVDEYKGQPGAEGIKNLRTALKNAKEAAKAKGIEIDDNGAIIEKPVTVSTDDVTKTAEQVYEAREVSKTISQATSNLDPDSKAVFDKEYKELTDGKVVTSENVQKLINAALAASGLNAPPSMPDPLNSMSGSGPRPGKESDKSKQRGIELATSFGYQPKTDLSKL